LGKGAESDHVNEKLWKLMSSYLGHERWFIQKQIVNHIEYTVVKSRFNFDKSHLSAAVASSIRDRLIECFNDTNQHYSEQDPKRVYYLSAEYLQGRMMQNILVNINLINQYTDSLKNLGYQLEELYEYECDLGLGSGGLGRLAACFLDSMTTLEIPGWGYGIRYHYGNFKQHIIEELGKQVEIPNFGYSKRIPWEI
jgi:starch phosphorylase